MIPLDVLPIDLRTSPRGVLWNYENRDGESTKVPYQAHHPAARAAVDNPQTWAPFQDAIAAYDDGKADGVGVVLNGDGLVGIDLDGCVDDAGVVTAAAREIVRLMDSYTEVTPSGHGLRIFARGTLPPGRRAKQGKQHTGIEVYETGKYLTVTGRHLDGTPTTIEERTTELATFHARVFGTEPARSTPPPPPSRPAQTTTLDDAALLVKASTASNGATFSKLWAGNVSAYNDDESAGDLALCNLLAFWTGCDADRMDRLFRQSGLMRPKWDSRRRDSTYGADTITKAIRDCRETYTPTETIELETDPEPEQPETTLKWPMLADAAYVGTFGTVVEAIRPFTEADPIALLLHLIVGFGNLVGRSPHFYIGATAHHANENVLVAGDTSIGRKGTAWDEVLAVLTDVDTQWAATRILGGLSSGEGLINAVRDASPDGEDPGVSDKRLLVVEPEFARTLRVNRREGNTLSTLLRETWDRDTLATMTRRPLTATGAHISVIGHITPRELRKELKAVDMGNGFANRYLFGLVKRSQSLPDGGRMSDQARRDLATRLGDAATKARTYGELTRTDAARNHYRAVYDDLTGARDGLVGALCHRATAHVARLSLLYALADASPVIALEHEEAAYALWQFCEASIRYVFGQRVGERLADYLLTVIRDAGATGLTQTEIWAALGRHRKKDDVHEALLTLVDYGVIVSTDEKGKGRTAVRWYASEHAKKAN